MTIKIFSFFESYGASAGRGRITADGDTRKRELDQFELAREKEKSTAAILAQLHAAEYSAMMARVSAWANLQYAPWPILVAALGLVSQMQAAVNIRVWVGVILTLVVYVAYQGTMVNSLYYVLLIERYLRPQVSRLVQTDEFWIHERVFQKIFPQNPGWWPYWPPVFSSVGIVLVAGWNLYLYGGHDWPSILRVAIGEARVNLLNNPQGGLSAASRMALEASASLLCFAISLILGIFIIFLTRNGKRLKDDIIEVCKGSEMVIDEPAYTRTTSRPHGQKSVKGR